MQKYIITLIIAAASLIFIATRGGDQEVTITPDSIILAFGDSITAGYGAKADESYPAQLAKLLGVRVINGGVSGEVSKAGLARLPKLLAEHKPTIVIICHGGNDILRRFDLDATRENIAEMIKLSQNMGAIVVLVGVPKLDGVFIDTASFYDKLASDYGVIYEDEIIEKIIKSPELKSDQIHPNKDGYLLIAQTIAKLLK
ncbi:arylesterase [Campylobacterota bacterium]|nr:arylesterase [Campylobacterota bacterium]